MEAVDAIIARTGLVLPLVVLFLVYLVVKYPNRLAGTHGDRPGVHTFPGLPIIGNTIAIVRRGTRDQFHRLMEQLELSTSPVYSWTFWPTGRLFMISRPEYIEYVQVSRGAAATQAIAQLTLEGPHRKPTSRITQREPTFATPSPTSSARLASS